MNNKLKKRKINEVERDERFLKQARWSRRISSVGMQTPQNWSSWGILCLTTHSLSSLNTAIYSNFVYNRNEALGCFVKYELAITALSIYRQHSKVPQSSLSRFRIGRTRVNRTEDIVQTSLRVHNVHKVSHVKCGTFWPLKLIAFKKNIVHTITLGLHLKLMISVSFVFHFLNIF